MVTGSKIFDSSHPKVLTPFVKTSKGHKSGCLGLKDGGLLGGGFKYFLFSPLPQEMIKFDYNTFQMD